MKVSQSCVCPLAAEGSRIVDDDAADERDDVDAQSRSPLSLSLPLALASPPTPAKAKELRNTSELHASIALVSLHRRQPASRIWESTACRRIGSLGTAPTELIRVAGLVKS